MSEFGRSFEKITGQVLEANPWFRDMLVNWRPAGDALCRDMTKAEELASPNPPREEDPLRLRLAIRNGYLNFYRGGQSIAKVDFGESGELQAHIHNKYVYDDGDDQHYVTLTSTGLHDSKKARLRAYGGADELRRWIEKATKHVHREKRFVDQVVARNPNTVDLEIGLPAFLEIGQKRTAPRMDLAALEPFRDGWRIVFWEAKLVENGEARCSGAAAPKVVGQLKTYTGWLRHDGHSELVAHAYREVCRLLVDFHEVARSLNPKIEELGRGIVAVGSEDAPLQVDDRPRLLIDDRTKNRAFTNNGHLDKLRKEGLHVQMVRPTDEMTLEARP